MIGAFVDALALIFTDPGQWVPAVQRHLTLSLAALTLSVVFGIAIGAWLTRVEKAAFAIISIANLGRTVPSLAVLALVYPFVGTGFAPALIALVAMGLPPVLLETYTAIRELDAETIDAARGMGLSDRQRLMQVELPAASPLILSGIRTSATQVIASATLAALIGGGGLGELLLAGLTNMRYDLLIAGALLVGALAILAELVLNEAERRFIPEGVLLTRSTPDAGGTDGYRATDALGGRRWRMLIIALPVAIAVVAGAGTGASAMVAGIGVHQPRVDPSLPRVVIGSKDFTEQIVLAELYAQALEARGYPVQRKLNLGATAVADAALSAGSIDMYPEYTGTSLTAVFKQTVPQGATADQVHAAVRTAYAKRNLRTLEQTAFSNGNAIVMRRETAEKLGIKSLTDLGNKSGKLRLGSVPGFDTREDGLPLLNKVYGMDFDKVSTFEIGLKYKALLDGKIDAVYGFETDGQIAEHDLVTLTDDRRAWPPYHAAPIMSEKLIGKAKPDLVATIDAVSRALDAPTMRRLNAAVDQDKRDPSEVAREFLLESKLA